MAINITPTTIQVGNFKFRETDTGIEFTGQANTAGFVSFKRQGTISGYATGGGFPPFNVIDKFPFAVDTNASDVGDLSTSRAETCGQSSTTHGYATSGRTPTPGAPGTISEIDRFPFAVDINGTNVGSLTQGRYSSAGSSSDTHGYTASGETTVASLGGYSNVIDKHPFFSENNAVDVGDVTQGRYFVGGASSEVNGYVVGGSDGTFRNTIERYPFSVDTNASDVADLTAVASRLSGNLPNSETHAYRCGGRTPPNTQINVIDKFPFATDANATDVGDLTAVASQLTGQSSTTHGYSTGDANNPNEIQKFPFAVDTNATGVGDMSSSRNAPGGNQV